MLFAIAFFASLWCIHSSLVEIWYYFSSSSRIIVSHYMFIFASFFIIFVDVFLSFIYLSLVWACLIVFICLTTSSDICYVSFKFYQLFSCYCFSYLIYIHWVSVCQSFLLVSLFFCVFLVFFIFAFLARFSLFIVFMYIYWSSLFIISTISSGPRMLAYLTSYDSSFVSFVCGSLYSL